MENQQSSRAHTARTPRKPRAPTRGRDPHSLGEGSQHTTVRGEPRFRYKNNGQTSGALPQPGLPARLGCGWHGQAEMDKSVPPRGTAARCPHPRGTANFAKLPGEQGKGCGAQWQRSKKPCPGSSGSSSSRALLWSLGCVSTFLLNPISF